LCFYLKNNRRGDDGADRSGDGKRLKKNSENNYTIGNEAIDTAQIIICPLGVLYYEKKFYPKARFCDIKPQNP